MTYHCTESINSSAVIPEPLVVASIHPAPATSNITHCSKITGRERARERERERHSEEREREGEGEGEREAQ